jgi:hypothetical protein
MSLYYRLLFVFTGFLISGVLIASNSVPRAQLPSPQMLENTRRPVLPILLPVEMQRIITSYLDEYVDFSSHQTNDPICDVALSPCGNYVTTISVDQQALIAELMHAWEGLAIKLHRRGLRPNDLADSFQYGLTAEGAEVASAFLDALQKILDKLIKIQTVCAKSGKVYPHSQYLLENSGVSSLLKSLTTDQFDSFAKLLATHINAMAPDLVFVNMLNLMRSFREFVSRVIGKTGIKRGEKLKLDQLNQVAPSLLKAIINFLKITDMSKRATFLKSRIALAAQENGQKLLHDMRMESACAVSGDNNLIAIAFTSEDFQKLVPQFLNQIAAWSELYGGISKAMIINVMKQNNVDRKLDHLVNLVEGKVALNAKLDNAVVLYDAKLDRVVTVIPCEKTVRELAISTTKNRLALLIDDTICLYDLAGNEKAEFKLNNAEDISVIRFVQTGEHLLLLTPKQEVKILNLIDGRCSQIKHQKDDIKEPEVLFAQAGDQFVMGNTVAFSQNGQYMAMIKNRGNQISIRDNQATALLSSSAQAGDQLVKYGQQFDRAVLDDLKDRMRNNILRVGSYISNCVSIIIIATLLYKCVTYFQ